MDVLQVHSDDLVVGLATAIAVLDVFFILVAVPESLPEKLRLSSSWSAHISWEQADPFSVSAFLSEYSWAECLQGFLQSFLVPSVSCTT